MATKDQGGAPGANNAAKKPARKAAPRKTPARKPAAAKANGGTAEREGGGRGRYVIAGLGIAAAAGVGYLIYRERSTEKPKYQVTESDGLFELREYPELLIAETSDTGDRGAALEQGFRRLADYIFAKSRDGEKIAMTAPVLSAEGGNGAWLTRFVMPAKYSRDTLPAAPDGVRIGAVVARKVAVMTFAGGSQDEALLAEKEAQLRSWVGAKKLGTLGKAERAFYNSPMVPAPMRKAEILIPLS